jgi:hypothetical protein
MIDHILTFADQASCSLPSGSGPSWRADGRTYMPVQVVMTDAVIDEDGNVTTPAVIAPGYWIVVRARERVAEIEALPGHLLTTDSDLAAAGKPFIYVSKFAADTQLGRISPVFAGDAYPFPSGPASNLAPSMIVG